MGTRQALFYSSLDRYAVLGLNLALTAFVGHLLSPKDVGIFTAAYALVAVAGAFREYALNAYLIQSPNIIREDVQTAFTISLLLSLLLAAIFVGSSGLVAGFYAERGFAPTIRVTSLILLVDTLFYSQYALLRREMAFGAIFVIDVAQPVANFVSFSVFAYLGWKYMSLAWAALVTSLTGLLVTFAFSPYFWVYLPNLRQWRKVLSFGGYAFANGLLTVSYSSLPQLILGRLLSFGAVGLYGRATTLCQMPDRLISGAVLPVLLPALAARARDGGSLKEPCLRILGLMTSVQWPLLLCLALLADPVVALLLGPQWRGAASLMRIMALGSMMMFPVFLAYPLLVALGHIRDMFLCSLIALPSSALLIFMAANINLRAVAASMLISAPLQGYLALRFIRRRVAFRWRELLAAVWKSGAAALCAAIAPAVAIALSGFRFDLSLPLALFSAACAVWIWLAGLRITGHPLLAEEMWGAAREVAVAMKRSYRTRLARPDLGDA